MLSEIISGLKRGFSLLESEKFDEATEVFKSIIEKDPKNAHGHMGLLLAEMRAKKVSHLELVDDDFSQSEHFKNAMKYGEKDIVAALNHCIIAANKRKVREAEEAQKRAEEEQAKRERLAIIEAEESEKRKKQQKIEDEQNLLALQVKEKTKTQKKKKKQKNLALFIGLIAFISAASVLFFSFYSKKEKLDSAKKLLINGDYVQAYLRYQELNAEKELSEMNKNANEYVLVLASSGDYESIFALSEVMQKNDFPFFDAYKAIAEGNYKKAIESGLTKLTYSKAEKLVKAELFYDCDTLEEITLPEGITSIGAFAFESCDNLKKVNLPSTLVMIEENAFNDCDKLQELTIPKNVYFIGRRAFENCKSLSDFKFESPDGWVTDGEKFNFVSKEQTAFSIVNTSTNDWIRKN
jgi:hypothetical protein